MSTEEAQGSKWHAAFEVLFHVSVWSYLTYVWMTSGNMALFITSDILERQMVAVGWCAAHIAIVWGYRRYGPKAVASSVAAIAFLSWAWRYSPFLGH